MKATAAAPIRRPLALRAAAGAQAPSATRQQILAVSARLFSERGFASTTLRQIAQEAGIQAGSIYHHFHGKDEIAACVLDEGIAVLFDAVHRRLDALPPDAGMRERLRAAVEGHLWGLLQRGGEFTAAHIRIYRYVSDAARGHHRATRGAYTRLWDELLQQAAEAGLLRDDMAVSLVRQFLVGALNWPVDWYDAKRGSVEELAGQLAALALEGITQRPAAAPKRPAGKVERRFGGPTKTV